MKKLASIVDPMARFSLYTSPLLALILIIAFSSCDDEKLESSTVRFTGRILNVDFSTAANAKLTILVRTDPTFTTDTTIAVRIPVTADASGYYDTTVHSDNFPAIPFYTVVPATDTLISLEIGNCVTQNIYHKIFPNVESQMNARFGAASFLKVSFIKSEQSSAISARHLTCNLSQSTSVFNPDLTFIQKLPYDLLPSQYSFFYEITYSDFSAQTLIKEVVLQPYDTTEVVLHY